MKLRLKVWLAWAVVIASGLVLDVAVTSPSIAQVKPAQATSAAAAAAAQQRFPDVIAAKVRASGAGRFDFDVTLSSPYDTPERYADAFRVTTLDGKGLGERILFHDHQDEQPFTRDLYGISIPTGVKKVIVQGRDKKFGYGGKTMEVNLPGR